MLKWFYSKGVIQLYHDGQFFVVRRDTNIDAYVEALTSLLANEHDKALTAAKNKQTATAFCGPSTFESLVKQSKIGDDIRRFVVSNSLEITRDGCFIGFKNVNKTTYCDHHTGKTHHQTGDIIQMDRDDVNPDPSVSCGSGLHVGTSKYVSGFNLHSSATFLVKVNPKNVVCVPHGGEGKIRCCEYTVLNKIDLALYQFNPHSFCPQKTPPTLDEIFAMENPTERQFYVKHYKADRLEAAMKNLGV